VSSVEQRDAFLRLNRNVHVLYMFPLMPARERVHEDRDTVVLGYHGNRVHLEAMSDTVTPAIEELARSRPVELVCVTNFERYGLPAIGMPDERLVSVRHVQLDDRWAPDTTVSLSILDHLAHVDIGLVPNLLPVHRREQALRLTASDNPWLLYEPFDYLLRLKGSSNPGRLYAFAQLGVPVAADFTPSLCQFVLDGVSGCLAATPEGWFEALSVLADSATVRQRMADELRARIATAADRLPGDLMAFLDTIPSTSRAPLRFPGRPTAEEDLERLGAYAAPSRPGPVARFRATLARRVRRVDA
jgi:hypothetical protein